jgi:tetratricopeptide (TPR) repeat protein
LTQSYEKASPDALIQQQQKQRAQQIKRIFIGLGALVCIALVVTFFSLVNAPSEEALVPAAPIESSFSGADQEAARDAFRQALSVYEQEIAPVLAAPALVNWKAQEVEALSTANDTALRLFANAAFVQALGVLNKLKADAQVLIEQWNSAFNDKLGQAQTYYDNGQIQQARLALKQAIELMPQRVESQRLAGQLAVYDSVSDALEQLEVAKVENNLEQQIALMQQILRADPTRIEHQLPLQQAQKLLKERRLSKALQQAEQALAADKLDDARRYLQQAQSIEANAPGLDKLSAQLNARLAQQNLAGIISQVEQLKTNDSWSEIAKLSEQALGRFPNNEQLKQSQMQASVVLDHQQSLARFIARPDRMADSNILNAAQNALQKSITSLILSPTLATQAQRLAGLIDTYNAKVEVTINSDKRTHLIVVGVGVVGEVDKYTIELTPGNYVLEGKRDGYRSKRLEFEVQANKPINISLLANEKIE